MGIIGCIANKNTVTGGKDVLGTVFVFIGKFGVSAALQGCFVIMEIFPSIIYSSTIGVCNFLGVTSTILALFVLPMITDPTFNIRLGICGILIVVAIILVPMLKGSHYILI